MQVMGHLPSRLRSMMAMLARPKLKLVSSAGVIGGRGTGIWTIGSTRQTRHAAAAPKTAKVHTNLLRSILVPSSEATRHVPALLTARQQ